MTIARSGLNGATFAASTPKTRFQFISITVHGWKGSCPGLGGGDTVVVTHHAPHLEATGPHRTELDPAYASDLADLIEHHAPALWVFGHTHRNVSFCIGRTQLVNAGAGYPREARTDQAGIGFVLREGRVNRQRNEQ